MSREVDWDRVAALYADRSITLKEIGRRCGVPPSTISSRAAAEGWPARNQYRGRPRRTEFRVLLKRMFNTLDRQIAEVEERLEAEVRDTAGRGAEDRARDARTLASLTRILEKLRELEREARAEAEAARAAKAADERGNTADSERLRRELERRLDRLLAGAGETGVSGKPE